MRHYSLADALIAFTNLDTSYCVLPEHARTQVSGAVVDILTAAEHAGISDVAGLVERHVHLLTALTGLTKPTAFQTTADADGLHRYRNLTLALVAAAAFAIGADHEAIYQRWTTLKARTTQTQRPLLDEEIVLARVCAAILAATNPTSQPANIYAMTDAGASPRETTDVTLTDFDDTEDPADLRVAGNGSQLQARNLPLDPFAANVLRGLTGTASRRGTPTGNTLTYTPRKITPTAAGKTASAQGVLDRMLTKLGLAQHDITAMSISLWRAHITWTHQSAAAAVAISGRKSINHLYPQLFRAAQQKQNQSTADIETSFM